MKTTLILLSFLLFGTHTTDPFYTAVKSLEKINYFIKIDRYCKNADYTKKFCTEKPENNCFVQLAKEKEQAIDTSKIISIRRFFVKSTKDYGGKTFPRADILEWQCTSVKDAEEIEQGLKKLSDKYSQYGEICENKSYATSWRKNDKLYFIITGGQYMSNELPKLEKQLKSKL
ncbi:MAG: hypothetical protein WBP45_01950 [Daejeonella sp.]